MRFTAREAKKRNKEMARRYEELATQPRALSREEREHIPLEEMAKWKQKVQEGAPWFCEAASGGSLQSANALRRTFSLFGDKMKKFTCEPRASHPGPSTCSPGSIP